MLSIFGSTGYVGSNFCEYKDAIGDSYVTIPRNSLKSTNGNFLYFISTNNNYNVFDNPHVDINTNLSHMISVLEANREHLDVFNFISSWFVYGNTDLPAREDSHCFPTGFYSITKKCAEDLLISYCKTFGINYRIIRLCNVYGKTDLKASAKKNALHYMVERVINNEEVNLYDGGNVIRDYMHINDTCEAIDLVLKKGGVNEIFNIGNGEPIKIRDIIDFSMKITKSTSKINHIEIPEFHKVVQVKDMYLDNSKLLSLGYKKKNDIELGIKRLCKELKKG